MNNKKLIQDYIESKISKKDFKSSLNTLKESELKDFLNCLLGNYGGIVANEILFEFSDFFILQNDFIKLVSKVISTTDHPLVHFTLFEFFMLLGITDETFYTSLKIEVKRFKPYNEFFLKNPDIIGSNSRFNKSLCRKFGITNDKLDSLKSNLL